MLRYQGPYENAAVQVRACKCLSHIMLNKLCGAGGGLYEVWPPSRPLVLAVHRPAGRRPSVLRSFRV